MRRVLWLRIWILLLCASFAVATGPADGQTGGIGPSKGQVAGVIVGIVAVGAAIGIGIYYLARRPPSLTGCVASGTDKLQLHNESDQRTYLLMGDVADVKPGDRVRVQGKKKKAKAPTRDRDFLVEKLSKDFGPCRASTP